MTNFKCNTCLRTKCECGPEVQHSINNVPLINPLTDALICASMMPRNEAEGLPTISHSITTVYNKYENASNNLNMSHLGQVRNTADFSNTELELIKLLLQSERFGVNKEMVCSLINRINTTLASRFK